MRKAFGFIEKGSVFLALIGLVFKGLIWKGGDLFLVIGGLLLSLLYFAGSYFQPESSSPSNNSPATTSPASALLKILSGIAFSTVVIALLFKLMFWQGHFPMLLAGLVFIAPMMLWAFVSSKGFTHSAATAVLRRGSIVAALGIGAVFISSSFLFRIFHRDDPQLVKKWTRVNEHPDNPTYQADFDAYRRQRYATHK